MNKTIITITFFFAFALPQAHAQKANGAKKVISVSTGQQNRTYWCDLLYKMASPVLFNLANGTLKKNMPLETAKNYTMKGEKLEDVTYLEALGRTIAGIAPWLTLPDDNSKEGKQRKQLRTAFLKGMTNAVDSTNPDYINFDVLANQPIVDAAYLAQAFLRAPEALWNPLDSLTKERVIEAFKTLRLRTGAYNNWLLFAGINEAFLWSVGEQPDPARIEIAKRKMLEWYVGDGWYSDGPSFSMDYYNSYVIHPMMVDFMGVLVKMKRASAADYETAVKRMVRYAEFIERLIAPDGSYPPFGRSVTYRTAAFQSLAQAALINRLPEEVSPAQVRCALTAVMHRMYDGCNNFDANGWLVLGFCGYQPDIADYYTSTGSMYMATLGFLPLGLPASDDFWAAPPADWTSKKAWSSKPFKKDYHVDY